MNLMGSRLIHLIATMAGYQKTGVSLIEFDGNSILPSITGDDIGIYVLIPRIACFFSLAIEQTIALFFNSLLIVPALVALTFFCFLYKKCSQKFVALSGVLLLTLFSRAIGDVYLAYTASLLMIIPCTLYFFDRQKWDTIFVALCLYVGIVASFMQYIRAFSGGAALLFFLFFLFLEKNMTRMRKILCMCSFFIGLAIPRYYFESAYNTSVLYAQKVGVADKVGERKHALWHAVYVGFGLLHFKNHDEIAYDDSCAQKKVESIDPSIAYCSAAYDEILKNEVINLIKHQFVFVLLTLFAKLGVLIYFLLKFANIGLIAAFFYPKSWVIELAFFCGLIFNSLFVFIAMPIHEYALGFIACATLYGIVSINFAIARMHFVKLPRWLLG